MYFSTRFVLVELEIFMKKNNAVYLLCFIQFKLSVPWKLLGFVKFEAQQISVCQDLWHVLFLATGYTGNDQHTERLL